MTQNVLESSGIVPLGTESWTHGSRIFQRSAVFLRFRLTSGRALSLLPDGVLARVVWPQTQTHVELRVGSSRCLNSASHTWCKLQQQGRLFRIFPSQHDWNTLGSCQRFKRSQTHQPFTWPGRLLAARPSSASPPALCKTPWNCAEWHDADVKWLDRLKCLQCARKANCSLERGTAVIRHTALIYYKELIDACNKASFATLRGGRASLQFAN